MKISIFIRSLWGSLTDLDLHKIHLRCLYRVEIWLRSRIGWFAQILICIMPPEWDLRQIEVAEISLNNSSTAELSVRLFFSTICQSSKSKPFWVHRWGSIRGYWWVSAIQAAILERRYFKICNSIRNSINRICSWTKFDDYCHVSLASTQHDSTEYRSQRFYSGYVSFNLAFDCLLECFARRKVC